MVRGNRCRKIALKHHSSSYHTGHQGGISHIECPSARWLLPKSVLLTPYDTVLTFNNLEKDAF